MIKATMDIWDIFDEFDPEYKAISAITRLGNALDYRQDDAGTQFILGKYDELGTYIETHATSNPIDPKETPGLIQAWIAEQDRLTKAEYAKTLNYKPGHHYSRFRRVDRTHRKMKI